MHATPHAMEAWRVDAEGVFEAVGTLGSCIRPLVTCFHPMDWMWSLTEGLDAERRAAACVSSASLLLVVPPSSTPDAACLIHPRPLV